MICSVQLLGIENIKILLVEVELYLISMFSVIACMINSGCVL